MLGASEGAGRGRWLGPRGLRPRGLALCLVLAGASLPSLGWAAPPSQKAEPKKPKKPGLVKPAQVKAALERLGSAEGADSEAALLEMRGLGPRAAPHLGPALIDEKLGWPARTGAAWVLGELGEPGSKAWLERALALPEAPNTFRVQVAIALGQLGVPEPLRALLQESGDKIMVAKAATAAANHRDAEALPLLRSWREDPEIGIFIDLALGRLGESVPGAGLRALLREEGFRDHAAVSLGMSGDRSVLLQVRYALENPDPYLRRDAAELLGRWEDVSSLEVLQRLLASEEDPRVQKAVQGSVRRLEFKARRR